MEVKEVIKETMIKWSAAVEFHKSGKYSEAVETYGEIKETSARIYYNRACAYLKLDNADFAIESLSRAIQRDEYLAVAFFQRGTLYLQQKSAERAVPDLETTLKLLRGNTHIDYKPLGLHVRLTSSQIRINLALAYACVGRNAEAQKLLTEALYDADVVQSKRLKTFQDKITENQPELVSAMQISPEKVFTPPKDVTQNLEKKNIVRRAKVVSALNPDDKSPAFHGSKRVKVLMEKLKSPGSQHKAAKQFIKNTKNRKQSTLVLNEETDQSGMKRCMSLSDLTVRFSTAVFGSKSPLSRIKVLLQKKHYNSTIDQSCTGVSLYCSVNDLVTPVNSPTGSNEKKPTRSLHAGVRKLFNNKRKGNSCKHEHDGMSALVKSGTSQTEDFGELPSETKRAPASDYIHALKDDEDKSVVNTELSNNSGSQTEIPETNMNANFKDQNTGTNVKKQRPPPPSYPPPPLPRKIIITL